MVGNARLRARIWIYSSNSKNTSVFYLIPTLSVNAMRDQYCTIYRVCEICGFQAAKLFREAYVFVSNVGENAILRSGQRGMNHCYANVSASAQDLDDHLHSSALIVCRFDNIFAEGKKK